MDAIYLRDLYLIEPDLHLNDLWDNLVQENQSVKIYSMIDIVPVKDDNLCMSS